MVNQHIGNHGLGIFWRGWIRPWAPPSRSNEDSQLKSPYNSLIIGPTGFGRVNQHIGNHGLGIFWCGRI